MGMPPIIPEQAHKHVNNAVNWYTAFGIIGGWGVMSGLAYQWQSLASQGWAAVVIVGILLICLLVAAAAILFWLIVEVPRWWRSREPINSSALTVTGNVASSEVKEVRTILRLRFTGSTETPHEINSENVVSWFAYWSPSANVSKENGEIVLTVPESWAIFVDFRKPTTYRQLIVGFTGGRPKSYEVRSTLETSAVVTMTGGMPACEMEMVTRT